MKSQTAVFTTDGVNRQKLLLPLSTLVESMESTLAKAIEWGMPYGAPANISHDLCRPCGWSEPSGIYIAKDRSRQVGFIHRPETEEEYDCILALRQQFMARTQIDQAAPYTDEIDKRVVGFASDARRFWHGEAAAAVEPGLAERAYPEFFMPGSENVDKDGLVDFAYLTSRARQIHPGVFHEPVRDVLLFAHRYFRRSLSLQNSINGYVLGSFSETAQEEGVVARLRLDPDMIGHPGSAHSQIELEYWNGPKYDDDIASIPEGVAEHKGSDRDRFFSQIDRTQVWWKAPETRGGTDQRQFRTFEIEELVEDESPGLGGNAFGCRYAHAEYDMEKRVVSHFDGAIRAYEPEAYLERIERRIDRAGKQADYTKLFRLDGAVSVTSWKRVLTDWYRGNNLVPEYLGAPPNQIADDRPEPASERSARKPTLAAFLYLGRESGTPPEKTQLVVENAIPFEDASIPVVELGNGKVAQCMVRWMNERMNSITGESDRANLATVQLGGIAPTAADWTAVARPLCEALESDSSAGTLESIALTIGWSAGGIETRLSIEGPVAMVASLLADTADNVDPGQAASSWIEAFRDALINLAPDLDEDVEWPTSAARRARLDIEHDDDTKFTLAISPATQTELGLDIE